MALLHNNTGGVKNQCNKI